jgi:outer membrane protein assembly factor BamB
VFVTGGLDPTASGAHDLYAFDAATGAAAWPPFRAPTGTTLLIGAVAGGRVFALGDDGTMYVMDAVTGRELWRAAVGSTQSPSAGIVGGTIYVTSDDRTIHAVDIGGRAPLGGGWPITVPGVPGSPAIIDGRILVGTSLGEVVSIAGR